MFLGTVLLAGDKSMTKTLHLSQWAPSLEVLISHSHAWKDRTRKTCCPYSLAHTQYPCLHGDCLTHEPLHKHCGDQGQGLADVNCLYHSNYLVVQCTFSSGCSLVSIDLCTLHVLPTPIDPTICLSPRHPGFQSSKLASSSPISLSIYHTTVPDPPIFALLDNQVGFCK